MNDKILMVKNYFQNIFDCNCKIEKSRIKSSVQTLIRLFLFIELHGNFVIHNRCSHLNLGAINLRLALFHQNSIIQNCI